jgi:hypothetical protein
MDTTDTSVTKAIMDTLTIMDTSAIMSISVIRLPIYKHVNVSVKVHKSIFGKPLIVWLDSEKNRRRTLFIFVVACHLNSFFISP